MTEGGGLRHWALTLSEPKLKTSSLLPRCLVQEGDYRSRCNRNTYNFPMVLFTFSICSNSELRPTRCSLRRDSGV